MRARRSVPKLFYLSMAVFVAFFILSIILFFRSISAPVDRISQAVQVFEVRQGETIGEIGANLHSKNLIRSPLAFKLAVKKLGLDYKIQAGTYNLTPSMSAESIALSLTRGISDLKITFPEGYRLEQMAHTASSVLGIPEEDFLAAAKGHEFELFPDTYFLPRGTTADKLVSQMSANFHRLVGPLNLTKEDVILASLVERETRGDEEKPIVAGILKKRLSAGWPLQLDATVQYALGSAEEWWPNTTLLDRKYPSPYNTYLVSGLPPSPICSPGLASLKAVLAPQDSPFWFYLHDSNGQIHYAKTSSDHEQNIIEFIR